jgi:hypothetical protein
VNLRLYVLDGKLPVVEPDLAEWSRWFATADRTVKQEWVGNVHISTVFLGLDHNFGRNGDRTPVLFETMLFTNRARLNLTLWRYRTWEEAEQGHQAIVERVKQDVERIKN